MEKVKRTWKLGLLTAVVFAFMVYLPVMASGLSDDNSLSALNVHNGTVEPEFSYSTWEYNVTVEPGTEELYLDPETSHAGAQVTSVTGTVLQNGEATVMINTASESGIPMTYTLHVTESGAASETESENESETEVQTEPETQLQTEPQTTSQPETEDNAVTLLKAQVDELKASNDLLMKIIYGLIGAVVVLLIVIINLLMKRHDLKKDLKDAEDQMAYQTNEFARKEKNLSSENYYAPSRQSETSESSQGEQALEETFGASPDSVQPDPQNPDADNEGEKEDVDVKMVEL